MLGRQVLEIHHYREVIAHFRTDNILAIFSFEHLLRAVLQELLVAFDGEGDEDLGFRFRGGEVEGYAVEVGDDLVDGDGRGSRVSQCLVRVCREGMVPREALREEGLDEDVLVVEEEHAGQKIVIGPSYQDRFRSSVFMCSAGLS